MSLTLEVDAAPIIAIAPLLPPLAAWKPTDQPAPIPDPPSQPWLRGVASAILLQLDPAPKRFVRAPFMFHHPRRMPLAQMLVLCNGIFPFAYGPTPLPRAMPKRSAKLPVITRHSNLRSHESMNALDAVSDERPLTVAELATLPSRPMTRGECEGGQRPCPWVSCEHHLFLEVHPTSGSIRLNHPGRQIEDLRETCALDVADRVSRTETGAASLSEVADLLGISHERVRQIEGEAQESFAVRHANDRRRRTRAAVKHA